MQVGLTAAVAGASGYAGGELLRLLLHHPDLTIGALAGHGAAGERVGSVHPHLPALAGRTFLSAGAEGLAALAEADVVFLALPHGASAGIASAFDGPQAPVVVDLGADHRLGDSAAWQRFYGTPYAGRWPYGLPELPGRRGALRDARRIAAPGCYPTSVIIALAPLLAAGLVEPDDVVVVAASGTTGAGRAAKPHLMAAEVMGALSAYKAGGTHQHVPEIEQGLSEAAGRPATVSFTPVLAPMPRGILATSTGRVSAGVGTDELRAALAAAYADEPFVRLLDADTWPHTGAVLGSNAVHLQAAVDENAGRAVVVSAIDNLGKGAAGQALQCANLALGLDETAGLSATGIAP